MEHCFSCRSGGRISESNGTPGKEVRFSERNVPERNCLRGRFSVKGTDLSGIRAKANATPGRSEPIIIFLTICPIRERIRGLPMLISAHVLLKSFSAVKDD